jgi:hypothetical protein
VKASDISEAVAAMEMASQFILEHSIPSAAELDMRTRLLRSATRLSAELSMIPVEIEAGK